MILHLLSATKLRLVAVFFFGAVFGGGVGTLIAWSWLYSEHGPRTGLGACHYRMWGGPVQVVELVGPSEEDIHGKSISIVTSSDDLPNIPELYWEITLDNSDSSLLSAHLSCLYGEDGIHFLYGVDRSASGFPWQDQVIVAWDTVHGECVKYYDFDVDGEFDLKVAPQTNGTYIWWRGTWVQVGDSGAATPAAHRGPYGILVDGVSQNVTFQGNCWAVEGK
jgi:hypothetical protein